MEQPTLRQNAETTQCSREGVRDMSISKAICSLIILFAGLGVSGGDLEAARAANVKKVNEQIAKAIDEASSGLFGGSRYSLSRLSRSSYDRCITERVEDGTEPDRQQLLRQCAVQACANAQRPFKLTVQGEATLRMALTEPLESTELAGLTVRKEPNALERMQLIEPMELTEPIKPGEPSELAKLMEHWLLTEPSGPAEPTEPTEPSELEPMQLIEPSEPIELPELKEQAVLQCVDELMRKRSYGTPVLIFVIFVIVGTIAIVAWARAVRLNAEQG